jgi:hypothetical protein
MMLLEGNVAPIWHMTTRSGEEIIELMPPCESKDDAMALIRSLMAICDVVRYVYFAEAWTLHYHATLPSKEEVEQTACEGLEHHPDRVEIVMFTAEDNESGMISGHRRIIRDNGRPHLGPLEMLPSGTISEGRMIGVLPRKGTLQ